MRMLRALLAISLLLASSIPSALSAATPEEVRESLRSIREERMQWELPREQAQREPRGDGLDLPIIEILLYTLAAAAVIALALFVASLVRGRRIAPPDVRAGGDDAAGVRLSTFPHDLAELAARNGDFAAAIHLLLLGTIDEIRASLGYDAPPSLTSREIVALAPIPAGGGTPLAAIVAAVERSHFGARPVGEPEYRRCVEWHEELLRACAAVGRPG
jgi:hypothetical protein